MRMIRDTYEACVSDHCEENKCGIVLPESFFVLCGERVRDELMSGGRQRKMCDCIIVDEAESMVTLAELKSGKPNAGMVKHAKSQLRTGLIILAELMRQTGTEQIRMQIMLLTKQIRDDSVLAELRKPVVDSWSKTRVIRTDCGATLPNFYTNVSVSDMVEKKLILARRINKNSLKTTKS